MVLSAPSDAMRDVLKQPIVGVIGTDGPHGPHLTPVWFEYADSKITVISQAVSQKLKNIERNPRVGFSVHDDGDRAVIASGSATIEPMRTVAPLEKMATRYMGLEGAGEFIGRRPRDARSIVITITVDRWASYGM